MTGVLHGVATSLRSSYTGLYPHIEFIPLEDAGEERVSVNAVLRGLAVLHKRHAQLAQ